MNILLINNSEDAEKLTSLLTALGLTQHSVRAIYPFAEYAIRVIEKDREKIEVVVIEATNTLLDKISITNILSMKFTNLPVLFVDSERKYERSDTPNIQAFNDLAEAAIYITSMLNLK